MSRRALWAIASLFAASACFDGAVGYDASAPVQIACETGDDCPPDWSCRDSVKRCVPTDLLAEVGSPELSGDSIVTPAFATVGTRVVARFSVTSALEQEPVVAFDLGATRAMFSPETDDDGEAQWVFAYEVTGAEPAGAFPVVAEVLDELGQAASLELGDVTLDFSPPRITAATVEPAVATDGATLTLTLSFNEPLPEPPTLTVTQDGVGTLALGLASTSDDSTTFTFTHDVTNADPEGAHVVAVATADAAGNVLSATLDEELRIDLQAPALVGAPALFPGERVRPGDIVRVTLSLTEPPAAAPAITVTPDVAATGTLPLERSADEGTIQAFSGVVPDDAEGTFDLELGALVDEAGNTSVPIALPSITVDATPPQLVDWTQSAVAAQPGTPVTITFSADEPLATAPVVTFAGVEYLPDDPGNTTGYTVSLDVAATSAEGVYPLQVTLRDEVANVGVYVPGSLSVDTAPPSIVDVTFTPDTVSLGSQAFATLITSEELGAPPEVTWSMTTGGPTPATFEGSSALTHVLSWVIDASVPAGALVLETATVEDLAGNRATVDLAAALGQAPVLVVDNLAPVVSTPTPSAPAFSAQTGHDVVTVTFDVSDDAAITRTPTVTVGGRAMTCGDYQETSPSFTCTYDVVGDEPEGALPVLATLTDDSGNTGFAASSVVVDFSAPAVVDGSAFLTLIGGPANLHLAPTQAAAGATVRVGFRLNEATDGGAVPTVGATSPAAAPFTVTVTADGGYVAEHVVDVAAPEGAWTIAVTARDVAGNEATSTIDLPGEGLVVDRTPPSAAAVDTADLIRLARVPWGSEASQGVAQLSVEADAAAFPGADVVVFFTAAAAPRNELGRATPNVDGSLDVSELLPADVASVWAVSLDEAGNESPPARIRDVEWVATLGGKVVGSTRENPHELRSRPFHTVRGEGLATAWTQIPSSLARVDGDTVMELGAGRWRAPNRYAPLARAYSQNGGVYDSARGVVVVFGGYTGDSTGGGLADTWELRDGRWHEITPLDPEGDGNPAAVCEHGMAYDSRRGVTVVYGGLKDCYSAVESAVWEFDGVSWARREATDPEADGNPGPRGGQMLAYDEARAVTLMYGGYDENYDDRTDLWAWDGTSWARLHDDAVGAAGPGRRYMGALHYDAANDRALVFGGSLAPDDEVWAYDGSAWAVVPPTAPEVDGRPAMPNNGSSTFDGDNGALLWVADGELWLWDGAGWARGPAPPVTEPGAPFAWHAGLGEAFLYEGDGFIGTDHDVLWGFDGTVWARYPLWAKGGQTMPPPRRYSKLVPNPLTLALEIDGFGYYSQDERPHVWSDGKFTVYDHSDPSGDGEPSEVSRARAMWHPGLQAKVTQDESTLWTHDGVEWHPTAMTDADNDDPEQDPILMGWDPTRDTLVGFHIASGLTSGPLSEAWEYAGDDWVKIAVADPEGDGNPAMGTRYYWSVRWEGQLLYDEVNDRLLYFEMELGAEHVEVWEWTGSSWYRLPVTDPEGDGEPSIRLAARVSNDPASGEIILVGGTDLAWYETYDDMWRFTGTSWLRQRVADPEGDGQPTAWYLGSIAVDPATGRPTLYGGDHGIDIEYDGWWSWETGVNERPSLVFYAASGEAGIDATSELLSLDVHTVAAGSGTDGAVALDGAELLVWRDGAWRSVATNDAAVGAPVALDATLTGRAVRESVPLWPGRETLVAVMPRGTNGTGYAEVELDYVELRLRYRLPPAP